jgi:antitoxin PrlF
MAAVLESYSRITSKGQITLPSEVRRFLGVSFGSRIAFRVEGDSVTVRRAEDDRADEDPAVQSFLDFLAKDMEGHPESISALSPALVERIAGLIVGAEVDPDEEIEGDVAI